MHTPLVRSPLVALLLMLSIALLSTACGGGGGGASSAPPVTPSPQPEPDPDPEPQPEPDPEPEPQPEPVTDIPAGGVSVITSAPATSYAFWQGDNNGAVGSAETVSADHEQFSQAVRVSVTNPSGEFYNGQLQYPTTTALNEDDVLLLHLYFRSVENTYETGAGFATVFMETPDYTKYVQHELSSAGEWQEYFIPLQMPRTEAAGETIVKIGFGDGDRAQVFEVGGVQLLNYSNTLSVDDLPVTKLSYVGREQDASWRAEANARIEQYRKGDFTVTVLDADGAAVSGAEVQVEFEKHAYHFGSVTVGSLLMGEGSDSDTYREKVLELFNQSGPENDLKWAPWAGEWGTSFNPTTTIAALQWLKDHDFYTRGHVLVWPSKRNLPELMQGYLPEGNPAAADPEAKQKVLDHIDDVTSATAAVLDEWDVLNEPYDNHYLMDAFGDEVMVDWFEQARTNLPAHKLYINDYSILSGGGRNFSHQDHYQQTIQYLKDNDAPIDGIGLQSHFGNSPTSISRIYDIIERFHQAFPDLKIRSTEFDVNTTDEDLQADFTRDFLTIFFSHPATVGVQKWGFWAGAHWNPDAAMYTQDWQEKPNAQAWKQAIYDTWWNDFSGTTNEAGEYANRGFYGEYTVTVSREGQEQSQSVMLLPDGDSAFTLKLAP